MLHFYMFISNAAYDFIACEHKSMNSEKKHITKFTSMGKHVCISLQHENRRT